jgi:NADPH:quinone reductase-like Zn-dependent oxidoreductase
VLTAVFGVTNARFTDAYAEYAIALSGMIARKPAGLDDIAAAVVPGVAVTAWQALFDEAHLAAGQAVLIHGAAGSVGAFAVQLGRRAGLRMIATAGAADLEYVRGLGADEVVDFPADRFEDKARAVDAVIDLVGSETQARSFAFLRPGGILVSAVSKPDQAEATRRCSSW